MRRVAALATQIHPVPTGIEAAGAPEPPALLAEDALKSFVESGYLVVHAGFSDEWHAGIGAQAEAMTRAHAEANPPITGSDHQDAIWGPLTPHMQAILTCPELQGALRSILGEDFVVGGGAHMHVSSSSGQQYHKDGTPVAIKPHEPRGVILMYYPNGASVEMGPTAVCPGSMYFSRDVHGAPDLSDHLNGNADVDDDPATRPIAEIGLPRDSQRIVAVPRGAILVAHEHLFHRGTASSPGAAFRPAFKMGARRVSEPRLLRDARRSAQRGLEHEPAPFGYTGAPAATQAIYEASWAWLCGARGVRGNLPRVPVSDLVEILWRSHSEVERTGAAYCLARTECGGAGADALLACISGDGRGDAPECVRRAAVYGLREVLTGSESAAARARVTAALVPMLRGGFQGNEGAVCGTAAVLFVLAAAAPATRADDRPEEQVEPGPWSLSPSLCLSVSL